MGKNRSTVVLQIHSSERSSQPGVAIDRPCFLTSYSGDRSKNNRASRNSRVFVRDIHSFECYRRLRRFVQPSIFAIFVYVQVTVVRVRYIFIQLLDPGFVARSPAPRLARHDTDDHDCSKKDPSATSREFMLINPPTTILIRWKAKYQELRRPTESFTQNNSYSFSLDGVYRLSADDRFETLTFI